MSSRSLCIIPARGGSKRFPGKNKALLGGIPLIFHTINMAVSCFDDIIFSSDDCEMLRMVEQEYRDIDIVTVDRRPYYLASDTAKALQTVQYYFDKKDYKVKSLISHNQIWLMLPTCPLRSREDVQRGIEALEKNDNCDGTISITDYDFPPTLGLTINEEGFIDEWDRSKPFSSGNSRSQDHQKIYRPNGAFYGMKWNSFRNYRNFYRGKIQNIYMPKERSIDVDTELDLKVAEAILSERTTLQQL